METPHPLSAQDFEYIFSRVPRLCVDLIVKAPGGIVLTLRALPTWSNKWHFAGGTVWYGETIAQAIERIAQKELGVAVTVQKCLGYMEFPSEVKERGYGSTVSLAFLCETQSTDFKSANNEASEIKIFSQLPDNMISEQRAFLDEHPEWRG